MQLLDCTPNVVYMGSSHAVVRVVCSDFVSKGIWNHQVLKQTQAVSAGSPATAQLSVHETQLLAIRIESELHTLFPDIPQVQRKIVPARAHSETLSLISLRASSCISTLARTIRTAMAAYVGHHCIVVCMRVLPV